MVIGVTVMVTGVHTAQMLSGTYLPPNVLSRQSR